MKGRLERQGGIVTREGQGRERKGMKRQKVGGRQREKQSEGKVTKERMIERRHKGNTEMIKGNSWEEFDSSRRS